MIYLLIEFCFLFGREKYIVYNNNGLLKYEECNELLNSLNENMYLLNI